MAGGVIRRSGTNVVRRTPPGQLSGAGPDGIPDTSVDLDFGLAWHVGAATLNRARGIVSGGSVLEVRELEPGRLSAIVAGTRSWPYETQVAFAMAQNRVRTFDSSCDCPMEVDCKHGVAALLEHLARADRMAVAANHAGPAPAAWESSLTRLLGSSLHPGVDEQDGEPAQLTALGLQFEVAVDEPDNLLCPVRLTARPMQRNTRDRWVTSGVSWRDLRYPLPSGRYPAEGLAALRAFADHQQRANPWEAPPARLSLDGRAGPAIWDLLERAVDAGVVLSQAGRDEGAVDWCAEPAQISIDLTKASLLTVTPLIRLAGSIVPAPRLRLVGDPAQAMVHWPDGDVGGKGRVVIARLRRSLSADLGRLIAAGPITVPAQDEQRFYREFLPRLRRLVPLESSDDSVLIPEPTPPRLAVAVTGMGEHRIRVAWGWLDQETGRRRVLTDTRALSAQDRSAMRASVDRLLSSVVLPAALTLNGPGGPSVREDAVLTGPDTVQFMTTVWPVLQAMPELETGMSGAAPEYREATGQPLVRIGADPATPLTGDWFDLATTVTIDDEPVPFELIFRALATSDSPMIILPSGTYFSLDGPRWRVLRALMEEARALHDLPPGGLRVDRYSASVWDELEASGLIGEQARAWNQRIRQLIPAGPVAVEPPAGLLAELREYQREGFQWLAALYERGLGGVLADDMGLGKTVQTLGLIASAKDSGRTSGPFLVVAPTSVVPNWAAEANRFTPDLRVRTITEGRSRRGRPLADVAAEADLVITSYALFRLEFADYQELSWSGLVLDEAQFVKNHRSKAFHCAKTLATPFKLAVTGTPLENNLAELWALLSITAPGLFPDLGRFTEFYRVPIERGQAPQRLAQLRRRIDPFLLRRTKEAVASDLPPKQEQVIEVELSPRHQQVYQRHLQRERQKILGLIADENALNANRFLILRSLTMLRQLSLDPSLVDDAYRDIPSSKLDVVLDQLMSVVESGHRVLVFSQFTRYLARARDRLTALGIDHCLLDGTTKNRAAVIEEFRTGTAPVFLISLKAGGFGLNLTEADYCILLDPWWNPAAENQAIDRTHRIGQTKSVMVYRYVARGTIEEKVMALKAGKARLFDDVLGASSASSTSSEDGMAGARAPLTAAEIRELIA